MDILEYFCNNKCMFKCDPNKFNHIIKESLKRLLLWSHFVTKRDEHHIYHIDTVRCMICLQICKFDTHHNVHFAICEICCLKCTNKHVSIMMYDYSIGFWDSSDVLITTLSHDQRYNFGYYSVAHNVVDNSHVLVHRYYHVIPIMFILSISDRNSSCYALNHDIVMFILKLIY